MSFHNYRNIAVRNRLEEKVRDTIAASGRPVQYEVEQFEYIRPETAHTYTPDFKISDTVYIEAKGIWDLEDRKKILLMKEQHPDVIICMAFQNAYKPIRKGSKTTYADWCNEHGIPWCDLRTEPLPAEWFENGTEPEEVV